MDAFKRGLGNDNKLLAFNPAHKKTNRREADSIQDTHLTSANSLLGIRLSCEVVALK